MAYSNSVLVKVAGLGLNVTSVPDCSVLGPTRLSGSTASPFLNRMVCSAPLRQIRTCIQSDSAFTTAAPTPCRPPDTL